MEKKLHSRSSTTPTATPALQKKAPHCDSAAIRTITTKVIFATSASIAAPSTFAKSSPFQATPKLNSKPPSSNKAPATRPTPNSSPPRRSATNSSAPSPPPWSCRRMPPRRKPSFASAASTTTMAKKFPATFRRFSHLSLRAFRATDSASPAGSSHPITRSPLASPSIATGKNISAPVS